MKYNETLQKKKKRKFLKTLTIIPFIQILRIKINFYFPNCRKFNPFLINKKISCQSLYISRSETRWSSMPITDFTLVFKLVPIDDSIKATQTQVKSKARSLLSLHLQTINPESGYNYQQ